MEEVISNLNVFKKLIDVQYISNKEYILDDSTLYFGTGLSSKDEQSIGFGIELLITAFTAIYLQKKLGFKKVIHEISTVGYKIDEENKKRLIEKESKIIENLIKNLDLENVYQINYSHDYHNSKKFLEIKKYVSDSLDCFSNIDSFNDKKNYTILQIAGMKYLYDYYNTKIKLGWITDKKNLSSNIDDNNITELIKEGHLNEFYFDSVYKYVFPEDKYNFLYTPCAFDFENGNRTVPYTVINSQNRPVLDDSDLQNFIDSVSNKKLTKKILSIWKKNIIEIFEELFYIIPVAKENETDEVIEKINYIKEKVLEIKK